MNKAQYSAIALDQDILLFKWKSEDVKLPRNPEFYLTTTGLLGYDLIKGRWVIGSFTKQTDELGEYTTFIYKTLATTPETGELKNNEEVIVCANTPTYRPNTAEREFFAEMKEETDKSIKTQLLNTRLNKALIAENDSKRRQILKAFDDVKDGKPAVIVTSLFEELRNVDLTDPAEIEKMQYLSSFYQTLEKRESNLRGLDLEIIDKKAQVTSSEIKQYDDFTTLEFLVKYEERLKFVEKMKEKGINIEIVPNPIFFDEPTKEDIEEGTFEAAEAEEEQTEENTEEGGNTDDNENTEGTV